MKSIQQIIQGAQEDASSEKITFGRNERNQGLLQPQASGLLIQVL